jgi:hypothetical protein
MRGLLTVLFSRFTPRRLGIRFGIVAGERSRVAIRMQPSELLTHGQHGPAEGLAILTYAYSEISHQNEPLDWVRDYGKGRVYTTMLGHTRKDEPNPNLECPEFRS